MVYNFYDMEVDTVPQKAARPVQDRVDWRELIHLRPQTSAKEMLARVIDPVSIYKDLHWNKIRNQSVFDDKSRTPEQIDKELEKVINREIGSFIRTSVRMQSLRDRATKIMHDHNNPSLDSWYVKTAERMLEDAVNEAVEWRERVVERFNIPYGTSLETAMSRIGTMLQAEDRKQWLKEQMVTKEDGEIDQMIDIETSSEPGASDLDGATITFVRDAQTWSVKRIGITEKFSYTRFDNEELPIVDFAKHFPKELLPKLRFTGNAYSTGKTRYANNVIVSERLHDYGEMQYWIDGTLKSGEMFVDTDIFSVCRGYLTSLQNIPRHKAVKNIP